MSRAEGSEEGAAFSAEILDKETPVSTSAEAACSAGACAGVKTAPAASTATDFAAAGKVDGLNDNGVAAGEGNGVFLTATEGVTTFGTALGAEKAAFKPRTEVGDIMALPDGKFISTLTGAALADPPAAPVFALTWARAS